MQEKILIKPTKGIIVRDPDTFEILPEEGKELNELTPYWGRRLLENDIFIDKKVKK